MKKKIFIIIIILALMGSAHYINQKEEKKVKIKEIDNQIQELFKPTIQNTTFTIDNDKYIIIIDSARFNVNEEDYFKRLDGEAAIDFSVYKNEIKDENLIGSSWYSSSIRRDLLESQFFIDNDGMYSNVSNIGLLFSAFNDVYYDYIYSLNNETDYTESSAHGSFDEENIEFDRSGRPTKKGYVRYYRTKSAKNLDMVFSTGFNMNPEKEKLNIFVEVVNLQETIKNSNLNKEKFNYKDKEVTLYYHKIQNNNIAKYNSDPLIIKKDDKLELIALASTSIPDISPNKRRIAYITPYEWEAIGELYIYDMDIEEEDPKKSIKVIKREDIGDQNTVKVAKWLDDRYILTVVGFGYGTVTLGGDLYLYDIENKTLDLILEAGSFDKTLPKERLEIVDFNIIDDDISIRVAKHDENYMEYILEEKNMKLIDIGLK
ncbi:DUF4652 domain-containing protein [Wukongibacter baidiensis]|uniref:DUF4652 domain-containing protein n=1 Tax=Wukongibacter baidiensis TaxID=1723361 RepID=UPI003D7FB66D